jgi:branched-chain amino acid transport system permease protein
MSAVHVAVLATLAAVLTALTALSGLLLPTLMLFTRLALSALLLAGLALPTLLRIALRVLRVARVLLVRHFDVLHGVSEAPPSQAKDNARAVVRFLPAAPSISSNVCKIGRKCGANSTQWPGSVALPQSTAAGDAAALPHGISLLRLHGDSQGSGRMEYFVQQLINGITLGSIYGLIAIGYTMVYGIIGMINFAHGDIFMVGAFLALIAFLVLVAIGVTAVPLALLLVLLVSMAITALYGWTVERIAYRPLRQSFRLAPLISAIGMSIVLQNYVQVAQGARVKPLPPLVRGGYTLFEGNDFAVRLSNIQIIVVLTTLIVMAGFSYLVARTRLGRNMRACEQDLKMAALCGINVDRTISLTFVIGAALAAVAGLMFLLYYGVIDFFIGFLAGVKAFTAAVLGGIGSLPGAMLGGILIGLIETMWSAYFSIEYKDVAAFSILIIVLIFLPTGILGRPEVEKV